MLRVTSAGIYSCDRTIGGSDGFGWDEFFDIKELSWGNFIITGNVFNVPGGFGNYDVYTAEVGPCFNRVWDIVHGGQTEDRGFAIVQDPSILPAPQFITVGTTNSFGAGLYDVYMIREWSGGNSGCNDARPDVIERVPGFREQDIDLCPSQFKVKCPVTPLDTPRTPWHIICQNCTPGVQGIPDAAIRPLTPHIGANSRSFAPVDSFGVNSPLKITTGLTGGNVSSYPNPVKRGESFTLDYSVAKDAPATITVSNVAGAVVFSADQPGNADKSEISTSGWPAGVYLIQVKHGDKVETKRVIVSDK
jgi:hypothetical protein